MSRSYTNDNGKRYFGAAADAHHTKTLGFTSAEEYADASYDDGYDDGYQAHRAEAHKKWKENQEAAAKRSQIQKSS
ncbi:MAG: hypothetical protein MSH15_09950 [Oscillospiraceae bacterium]|nr:hypothetical protein [Oscillospiraceae bacterium]